LGAAARTHRAAALTVWPQNLTTHHKQVAIGRGTPPYLNGVDMRIRSLVEKYWKAACVILGCWTFLALLFTPQTYLSNLRAPTPLTWAQAFLATLLLFYVWAALTPLVLWLGGRFALEHPRLSRNLVIHLALSVPISLAHILILLGALSGRQDPED
jgi:hypothetical protein